MSTDGGSLVGQVVLGHVRIVQELARGGMGVVYLARLEGAAGFVRPVVVKRILPELLGDPEIERLFVREARIMAQLQHPNIVSVLDFAEHRGAYLMVLEYVHGFHWKRWQRWTRSKGSPFPAVLAVAITIDVLEALHYAHTLRGPDGAELHIVHRDVSPSNVLIDVEGHVKLADFGVARSHADRTEAGKDKALKGKFSYLAPELLKGGEPSPTSDVYSAGVTLHEILTGRNEFHSGDVGEMITRVLVHELTPLHHLRADVPEALGAVIGKATAREPERRFQSALELADALRAAVPDLSPRRAIADAARADFLDPKMPEHLGLPPLETLDHQWREHRPSDPPPPTVRELPPDAAPPTVALPPSRPASRRLLVPAVLVALVAAVILAVGWGRSDRAETRYVVVQGDDRAPVEPPVSPHELPAPPAKDPGPPDPPSGADPGAAGKRPRAAGSADAASALTRAFLRRQGQVAACFGSGAAAGTPEEIAVRFRVGSDGRVTSAELLPPSIASTPAGQCVLGVARSTEFPAQPAPVTFRIPIRVRRAGPVGP